VEAWLQTPAPLTAVLPETVLSVTVAVCSFQMPPPLPPTVIGYVSILPLALAAVLLEMVQVVRLSFPEKAL